MDVPPPPDVFQILVTYKICFELNNKKILTQYRVGFCGGNRQEVCMPCAESLWLLPLKVDSLPVQKDSAARLLPSFREFLHKFFLATKRIIMPIINQNFKHCIDKGFALSNS